MSKKSLPADLALPVHTLCYGLSVIPFQGLSGSRRPEVTLAWTQERLSIVCIDQGQGVKSTIDIFLNRDIGITVSFHFPCA
jgi:hypothetical protein